MLDIQLELNKLLQYGLNNQLIQEKNFYYSANKLIELLNIKEFTKIEIIEDIDFYQVLNNIIDYAYEAELLESNSVLNRDLFDSQLMGCILPRPNEVNHKFWNLYHQDVKEATDYYYDLSKKSNYIRQDRITKNVEWKTNTDYGLIDITINLSKPEKDPEVIAKAKDIPKTNYPKCLLCQENEGYSEHLSHPGRSNHRLVSLKLNDEPWYLQYSPYVYYNEHCVVFREEHVPMKITETTFKRLLDFVTIIPHYFVGSNADLPIVGGTTLSHDHFQGGNYEFAMMRQRNKQSFTFKDFEDVEAGIVDWPMSVIRLRSENKDQLVVLGDKILQAWKNYTDELADIVAFSKSVPHNTITPIARFVSGKYELNLVLRNNRTTNKHPLGIFHPHKEHHHLKKENIGLIEVMGQAVLPARLKTEISLIKAYLINPKETKLSRDLDKHSAWVGYIKNKYSNLTSNSVDNILQREISTKFKDILVQCGVFKDIKTFMNFISVI